MSTYFSAMDISASGLTAERIRMEVTANNMANANTTRGVDGEPFRRQMVVFEAVNGGQGGNPSLGNLGGVRVAGIEGDQSAFPKIEAPWHVDADEDGFLRMPNVQIPNEMVDLITASRSYEANLKAMASFKEMIEQSLNLLKGVR